MSAPMASATDERVEALATQERLRRRRRLYRRDLLTSLWAPVTVLALLLVPYLLLIELHPPNASWAEPTMRWLGLACVLWFGGLLVWRLGGRRTVGLRHLRHEAREALADVEASLRARPPSGRGANPERLAEQKARVEAAMVSDDEAELEKQTHALVELAKRTGGYRQHGTLDLVSGLAKALLVALLIRTVLIEPFKIPSGSMIPTLEIGDQIFVNKFIYGVRIPFLNTVPFPLVRRPQRGDVIVFNNPVDTSKDFIKRVVGIPGDVVELRDEVLYINGREQPRTLESADYTGWDEPAGGNWTQIHAQLYRENLDGHLHQTLQEPPPGQSPYERSRPTNVATGPFIVPEGSVFVMGDNRDNSADSRFGLGGIRREVAYVPYGNIKGKAMIVWLSLGHGGLLSGVFGGTGIRSDRFFHPVR
jgi:signal peptidase I